MGKQADGTVPPAIGQNLSACIFHSVRRPVPFLKDTLQMFRVSILLFLSFVQDRPRPKQSAATGNKGVTEEYTVAVYKLVTGSHFRIGTCQESYPPKFAGTFDVSNHPFPDFLPESVIYKLTVLKDL